MGFVQQFNIGSASLEFRYYMDDTENEIRDLAKKYAKELNFQIQAREEEMENDDTSHYLIYRVLGITDEEGELIDSYQNKGRFLYRFAGSFLENAALLCFQHKYPGVGCAKIPNTRGKNPKTFQIDCLINNDAIEVKWRDATTDGDHITKEHTRVKVIRETGYTPIRVMFYYPNRAQAIRIQDTLKTLYHSTDIMGQYYSGNDAWEFIKDYTDINLKEILELIAEENRRVVQ
jgi:hypothetical protein